MNVPPELLASPPRDVRRAQELFAKQRAIMRACLVGGVVVAAAFMIWGRVAYGSFAHLPWVTFGVAGFVWSGAAVMFLDITAAKRVFVHGVLLEARVTEASAHGDPHAPSSRKRFVVRGAFRGPDGTPRTFLASTYVQVSGIACNVGDSIAVLCLPDRPRLLVACLPGVGMVPAVAS